MFSKYQILQTLLDMKKILLILSLMWLSISTIQAQVTYSISYLDSVGNPGGLNTTNDNSYNTLGWFTMLSYSSSLPRWSPIRALPFPFDLYGQRVTHYKIAHNGVMTFDTSVTTTAGNNALLPTSALPDKSIACFWDDYTFSPPINSSDKIRAKTLGTAPNRQYWVWWRSVELGPVNNTYFGLMLEERTNKIHCINSHIGSHSATTTSTVGVQLNSTTGTQYGTGFIDLTASYSTGSFSHTDNSYYTITPNYQDDAGLNSFADTLYSPGSQNISVELFNHGSNTLTTATINWTVNGVAQTPVNWTGSLLQNATQNVSIGSFNFNADSTYQMVSWVENPNNNTDQNHLNDTLQLSFCPSLNGNYTVGGGSADFNTLQDALARLESCGVSGAVTLTLNAGVYEGPFFIGEVSGTNATNTITIDGVNASNVMLRDTLDLGVSGYLNTMFMIQGTDYLTIKNISAEVVAELQGTMPSNYNYTGYCFSVTKQSSYFTFENNKISWINPFGGFSASTYSSSGVFFFDKDIHPTFGDHIVIRNNELLGGDVGISFIGSGTLAPSVVIEQNQILHCNDGIYLFNQDSVWVTDNVMDGRVYSTGGDGLWINKNRITGEEGIFLSSSINDYQLINNVINAEKLGIRASTSGEIWHNTVRVRNGNALQETGFNTSPNLDIQNNIFISDSGVAVLIYQDIDLSSVVDNNIYMNSDSFDLVTRLTTGGTFHYSDLDEWKLNMSHLNGQSTETTDSSFINLTTLKPNYGIAVDNGANTLGILEDVIGGIRPQLNGFDIGAYEYQPLGLDAGISGMIAPSVPVLSGNQPVKIGFQNAGTTTLTSATINWKVNDTLQTPFIWSGNLATALIDTITIGMYDFQTSFVSVEAWFTDINGQGSDDNLLNDTVRLETCQGLRGIYTIGNNNADFLTFAEASSALSNCGVSDTVIFQIQAGVYNEPLILEEIIGADATRPIIFDGIDTSLVTIENTTDPNNLHSIYLNGADHIVIRNLTVRYASLNSNGSCIYLDRKADFNTIETCKILPDGFASGIRGIEYINFSEPYGDYLTIRNNFFYHVEEHSIFLWGDSDGELTKHTTIENNIIEFEGVSYSSVELSNQSNLVFSHNKISTKNETSAGIGAYIYQTQKADIIGNEIISGLGASMSIRQSYLNPIYTDTINVINNIFNMAFADSIAPFTYNSWSLNISGLSYLNIWHNTIVSQYGKGVVMDRVDSMDMRNNIVYTGNKNNFALSMDTTDIDIANYTIDYNNFYSPDALLIEFNSDTIPNFATFQTTFPQWNTNSIGTQPILRGFKNVRLLTGPGVDAGDNSLGILDDIDGEARPFGATVDMGADEVIPLNSDLGIVEIIGSTDKSCGNPNTMIDVVVRNFGLNTFANATIKMEVTGGATNTFTSSLSNLSPTDFDTLSFGPLDTYYGETYQFTVFIENNTDDDITNDTLEQSIYFAPGITLNTVDAVTCLGIPNAAASASYPAGKVDKGYVWFNNVKDVTSVLSRNNSFNVPFLLNDTTYQVVGVVDTLSVGLPNLNSGTVASSTNRYFAMDVIVEQPLTIDTITIYPDLVSTIKIRIVKGNNYNGSEYEEIIHTITPSEVGTALKIPMNIYLAEGQYNITLGHSSFLRLFRHTSGVPSRYEIPNVLTLQNHGAANTYNYFYDWKITQLGCDAQPVNFIISDPQLTNIEVDSVACFGDASGTIDITVDGGAAPYTFNWSNNATSEDITNLATGTYQVTFTDAGGCSGTSGSPINVPEPNDLVTNLTNIVDASCFNGGDGSIQVAVTGGGGNYMFNWSNNSTNSVLSNLSAGNYGLTVTDGNNCTDTTSYIVDQPTPVVIEEFITALDSGMLGLGMATVVVSGGTPNYTYLWDANANNQITATAVGLVDGFYLVDVMDANGCTTTDTAFIFTVGNDEKIGVTSFRMYPNPTAHYVNIELELVEMMDVEIEILDVTGRLVQQFYRSNISQLTEQLPLINIASGVYLMKIKAGNGIVTKRLIISD